MDETLYIRDCYAATAGREAIELMDRCYGRDWCEGVSIGTLIHVLAEKKLQIADAMFKQRNKFHDDT